jgi:hypothetical protein
MHLSAFCITALSAVLSTRAQSVGEPGLISSTTHYGPNVTVEFLFNDYSPIGVTVSAKGRKFINFNRPANYTLVELVNGKEVQFPSVEWNNPPMLANNTNPAYGAAYNNYLVAVQSVVGSFSHKTSRIGTYST